MPLDLRLTRVSGPTQCMVGPQAKSEEVRHIVTTCMVNSSGAFWGWVPSFVDLPLWSLNAPCAKHKKSPNEDNPLQSDLSLHTQSSDAPPIESDSSPESS